MRTFFQEGDLLVAEVQAFFADGAMSLHTRSLKYGKVRPVLYDRGRADPCFQLRNGMLVIVPPSLIVRLKSHFNSLPCGVDLIIGLNGYIWVSKTVAKALKMDGEEIGFGEESGEGVYSGENEVRALCDYRPCSRPVGHRHADPTRDHARVAHHQLPGQVLRPNIVGSDRGGVRGVAAGHGRHGSGCAESRTGRRGR